MKQLPNILTTSRIVIIPPMIYFLMLDQSWAAWVALGLYIYACVTDFFDGYLAREMKTTSNVGKFLDPIADKLLIASLLLTLAYLNYLDGFTFIAALVILIREIFISGLREYLGPKNIQVPVSALAKWKTMMQMFALGFLMMTKYAPAFIPSNLIGEVLIIIAALLSIITAIDYTKIGLKEILEGE